MVSQARRRDRRYPLRAPMEGRHGRRHGLLALIPLEQFRQIAIAMALGIVLDAIAVRSLPVPARLVPGIRTRAAR